MDIITRKQYAEKVEKRAIKMLRGVTGVTIPKHKKTGLQMSIDEVRSGKLYEAKDVDNLMNQLNS